MNMKSKSKTSTYFIYINLLYQQHKADIHSQSIVVVTTNPKTDLLIIIPFHFKKA